MRNARAHKLQRLQSIAVIACVCTLSTLARADAISELDDAVARMQFAYFTNDVRGVSEALDVVAKADLPPGMKGMKEYFTAYGRWRLAELHADAFRAGSRAARSQITQAANACEDAAEAAIALDARMAEAHALEAICASMARSDTTNGATCSKHKGLRTALELAPNNPRVLLIDAQCTAQDDRAGSMTPIERLNRVVRAFESAPASQPGRADWGHAEALVLLGEAHLARGNAVAARDVIERALVIAPDYEKAKAALRATTR